MSEQVLKPGQRRLRYCIRIQQRAAYNGRFPRDDWRAYRKWSVWPILFPTRDLAEEFMSACFTFKGLHGRKMSASVDTVYMPHEEQAA